MALAGRLKVSEERAIDLMRAAGNRIVMVLLGQPVKSRDHGLSAAAREAIAAAIVTDHPVVDRQGPVAAALALRAALPGYAALSGNEKALLTEWLDRIVQRASPH